MKNNYLLLPVLALFSGGVFAQENAKYDSQAPYQKTLNLKDPTSKEVALSSFGKSYGLDNDNTFESKSENSDISGSSHKHYQQFYKGLKVEFGVVITHSRKGKVESVNGELYNAQSLNLKPSLTKEQGLDRAIAFMGAKKYLWDDVESSKVMEYKKPTGELVIFPMVNSGKVKLAYMYDIYAAEPLSRDNIYVDAHTGEILFRNPIIKHAHKTISNPEMDARKVKVAQAILSGQTDKIPTLLAPFAASTAATRYNGSRTIQTDMSGANYILSEATRTTNGITGNGMRTYNSGKTAAYPTTDFTNATTSWTTGNYAAGHASFDNAALDAHWGAEKVFDWWATVFNRNSYDNAGAKILSWVHYDNGYDNAFWNGFCMTYGDGSAGGVSNNPDPYKFNVLTALDICGHEIGHAVCSYTADLAYQNHSGALNEGLSDIWGSCIEWWTKNGNFNMPAEAGTSTVPTTAAWQIGEDIQNTPLRSMSWPIVHGNPDTFKGTLWITTADDGSCTPKGGTSGNDYCGVHSNSGVLNHWFYLLTIGKTNWTNNASPARTTTTTGIGMEKAARITYLAESDYLTPNATYFDMRNATIEAAKILYGCGSAEHIAVMNSWYAVNVGTRYTDTDLRVASISGDSNVACGASHSFSFTLQNDSSPSISTSTITYSVDGGAAVAVPWTGSALTGCGTKNQNYTVSLGTLSRGTHAIVVTATTTGDIDATNNSKTTYVTVNDAGTIGVTNSFTSASDILVAIDANGTTNTLWQRSTGSKSPILPNSQSDKNGMITKTLGNYPDNKQSYLVSQCYNLLNYSGASVSFDMSFDLESNWDILYFEYSTDNGATWNVLGTMADPNWYNSNRLPDASNAAEACYKCIGKQWTGVYSTAPTGGNGTNGNRRNYSHSLTSLGNPTNAIFRFNFISDEGTNRAGVFIDNFVVSGTLGTNHNSFDQFAVYPNPSKGKFNIVLSTSDKVNVQLYDMRGRSVYSKSFEAMGVSFNKEIDLNSLSSGIYILNVESNGKKEAKRIVVE